MSHCQDFCTRPMCVLCGGWQVFIHALIFSYVHVCVCGQLQRRCMDKSVSPLWLSSCPAVICADSCVCVCVRWGCARCGVQMSWSWCPASNKGFCGAKWRGGQPGDWQGPEAWVKNCVIMSLCGFWAVNGIDPMLYPYSEFPNSTCLYSLSHRVCVCILDDVMCSCCMADRQFPHHNMGPYGPPVRLIDRWMTPMRTSHSSS